MPDKAGSTDLDMEPEVTAAPQPPAPPVHAAALTGQAASAQPVTLSAMMALPEPARSDALRRVVESGAVFYLRAKGKEIRKRHGEHILVVPTKPKPFVAGHAIHLLWYCGDRIEEVEEA